MNRLSITELEAAWLAGIIDGEGFVGVVYAKRGKGSDARYSPFARDDQHAAKYRREHEKTCATCKAVAE